MSEFYNGLETLSEEQMTDAISRIMDGGVEDAAIKAFLVNMAERGETVEELTGAARAVREKAAHVAAPYGAVDCCGTGGDKRGTYNISTAVALVAAACGVPMAKHGNRASSSKSGAADVLEYLGVNINAPTEALEEALKTLNFAFLMAPYHHTAMKHVASVRQSLDTRTIFNLLGPLANPAGTRLQLMGVYDRCWVRPIAETLRKLGARKAWVVHGSDGLDEITVSGPTYVAMLDAEGNIEEKTLTPQHFGLPQHDLEKITGGDAEENAMALRALLEGQKGAYRDIVLANCGAVLVLHGRVETLEDGAAQAAGAIDDGSAMQVLKDYTALTRGA